jgi:hypothetical protein
MKAFVTILVVTALFALASLALAAEQPPAPASTAVPSFLIGAPAPTPQTLCQGDCTLKCSSGTYFYYYTTSGQCCALSGTTCPDGSEGNSSVWFPVTCGHALKC